MILLGVMVMIVAMPTGANKARKKHRRRNKRAAAADGRFYKEQLQQQLKEPA